LVTIAVKDSIVPHDDFEQLGILLRAAQQRKENVMVSKESFDLTSIVLMMMNDDGESPECWCDNYKMRAQSQRCRAQVGGPSLNAQSKTTQRDFKIRSQKIFE
jgi:hypothetical protein